MGEAPSRLIRISTIDGSYTDLGSLGLPMTAVAGVIDENSQYWLIDAANIYYSVVNLVPGAHFGAVVHQSPTGSTLDTIEDWAFVPGSIGGNKLYGLASSEIDSGIFATILIGFDRQTLAWTRIQIFPQLGPAVAKYQAVFAGVDSVFAVDSITGNVYSFTLPHSGNPAVAVRIVGINSGPTSGLADGARCLIAV